MKTFSFSHLMVPVLLIVSGALTGSGLTWVASLRRKENADGSGIYNMAATMAGAERWASATGAAAGTNVGADVADDASVQKLRQIIETIDSERRADDLHHFGREMAARNATMALALAGEIAGDSDQWMYMKGVFATWAQKSPQEAAAYAINTLPAGRLRAEAIRLSMGEWGAVDARGAFEWMEATLHGPVKEASLVALAEGWSRRSPEQAAAWFAESGSTSQALLTTIASTWARQDSVAALEWAAALGDPALRTTSLNSVLGEMARLDPVAAVQAAAPYLQPASQAGASGEAAAAGRDVARTLADVWGTSDPAAAARWIDTLPAGPAQVEAAGTLAAVWATSDIEAAVAWTTTLSDAALKESMVTHLGTTWGAIEPDRALAWLDTLPPDVSSQGIAGAFNSWAATDPIGLADWISQLPASPRNDLARRSLGDVISDQDPLAALELAAGISNPIQQKEVLATYYRQLHRSDTNAAIEWLQGEWPKLPAPAQHSLAQEQQKLLALTNRRSG
jgi:hypothetical protein